MLEQQVTGFLAAIKEDLLAGEKKVYEGIVLSPMLNTIQETIFRNYYLPCFAGFVSPQNWMLNWIQVAGSPTAEVIVQDASGQSLFQVPPLLATAKVILVNRAGSLNDIFHRQELLKNSLGGKHSEYVFQELERKQQELNMPIQQDTSERWDAIFQRYNVPVVETVRQGNDAPQDDIFQY